MISLVAKCKVKEGKTQEFLNIAKELVLETKKENGCIIYDLHKNDSSANDFAFIEQWENQESLNAHKISSHFTNLIPKIAEIANFEVDTYLSIS